MFLGDVASGAIHWATDVWFDEVSLRRLSAIGREHHIYPQHILDYPFRDYVGYTSWPSVLFFAPMLLFLMFVQSPTPTSHVTIACLAQVTGMMFFGTHFHRFGHAAARNPIARVLQKAHLLITPAQHAMHHYGTRRTHYCVVNGWANPIFDGLKIWRFLEWVTHSLTGAVPHRNETEWYQRFVQDPTFMVDPVPSLIELRAEAARVSD